MGHVNKAVQSGSADVDNDEMDALRKMRQHGWIQVVFGLSTFLLSLQTGSLKEKMDPAVFGLQESFDLFEVDNHTYSRVNIVESNDSLNFRKVSETYEEKTIGDKFTLSFGQQLAILVSFWLLASIISVLAWPCAPLRRAVGLQKDEEKSWSSWGRSWLSWSAWQYWWYTDQHS